MRSEAESSGVPALPNVKTARWWRGIVVFTHLAREGAYDRHHRTAGIAGCTRRRGSGVAARGGSAAAGKSRSHRIPRPRARFCLVEPGGGAAGRSARPRLGRGQEHRHRVSLGGRGPAAARVRGRVGAHEGRRDLRAVFDHGRARPARDQNHPHCVSPTMPTRSAAVMWQAFRGPAATSPGCRRWPASSTPGSWRC